MVSGRKSDPTRATRGTGNRPLAGEPKPALVAAPLERAISREAPAHLSDAGKAVFSAVVAELESRGLREVDLESVAMLAEAAATHREARKFVAEKGMIVKGPRGPMLNPMLRVARDEANLYLRLANEFGLTVGARLRLGLIQLAGQSILASLNEDLDKDL